MAGDRRSRTTRRWSLAVAAASCIVLTTGSAAFAGTPTSFTAGDLVIYETMGTSSAAQAVDLVDYTTAGVPSGYSVALPTANSGSTHELVESGSALNDGELTLSADGASLIATGYEDAVGTAGITGLTVPRTVAIVSPAGVVDTSTALADTTAEGNNFRSATTAFTGGSIYTGSGGGAGIEADGATASSYLNSDKVHEIEVVNNGTANQLYESTTTAINQVGTALPTGGAQTDTSLITGTNLPAHFGPDGFAFVTLGGGTTPNTLYVADGSNGATTGDPSAVEKYSLEGGVWTATGSVSVPLPVGIVASVATGGAVNIYVTGALATTGTGGANNTILYGITDNSGFGGSLSSSTVRTLATAPAGTDFHGLAFAPSTPGSDTPEAPLVLALPVIAAAGFGTAYVVRRRAWSPFVRTEQNPA